MELEEFKNRQYPGAAALAEAATDALTGTESRQEKGTVTAIPDERTVRYYLSEGLIPQANEKKGTSTLFGYIHLLALLAIKKLQAENLPIKKIREIIENKNERELEKLLGGNGPAGDKNEAQAYLETLLLSKPSQTYPMPAAPPPAAQQMQLFSSTRSAAPAVQSPAPQHAAPSASWSRFEIAPGVELHVSSDLTAPADDGEVKGILGKIEKVIRSFIKK
jgi:DNA-binding transcriptional MerR regulator